MKFFAFLCHLSVTIALLINHVLSDESTTVQSSGCHLKTIDARLRKSVCVCSADYCDELRFEWPKRAGQGLLVQSTKGGLRFAVKNLDRPTRVAGQRGSPLKLKVDLDDEYQEIMGFGGAFTDAAGLNIQSLDEPMRHKLMESYYGEHGSQYTFGRVVIAGADFSTRPYSYDDAPAGTSDFNLTNWSLAPEDHLYKIPTIKLAQAIKRRLNSTLKLYASSWSPPAFMKTSKSLVRGHLLDEDRVYAAYAQYLINFYEAYKREDIHFWGGTVQNEPVASDSPMYNFNSLQMGAEQAAKFVGKYLGPALAAHGYTKNKFKLMVNDDNINTLLDQVPKILEDEEARQYISGVAYHWYSSGGVPYSVIGQCREKVKDHIEFMLMTEACVEPGMAKPVDLGSWERGDMYANDIIEDLWQYTAGWVDWNLALDEGGGPNWVNNFVDSPIIISNDRNEFYKQPMYYVLAHFSRFFRPGSVRVGLSTGMTDKQLKAVAVHKKDTGHVVVNILNRASDSKLLAIDLLGQARDVVVQGTSLTTVVIKV